MINPNSDRAARGSFWRGLPLALSLGILMLALALLELRGHYAGLLRTRISQSAVNAVFETPALRSKVSFFAFAQITIHLLFGVAVWLAARLTVQAWPGLRPRLVWLVCAWFAAGFLLVALTNAALFPWSVTSPWARIALSPVDGSTWPAQALASLLGALILGELALLMWRSRWRRQWARGVMWSAVAILVLLVLGHLPRAAAERTTTSRAPNVVFIGVDSLRTDVIGTDGTPGYTPNITAFLKEAHLFTDAITPLARTFPSWMTLLTGQNPMRTGVRENLIPRKAIRVPSTLADRLRAAGYRTVFATDEVRFSNIDQSYGFDQTITPRIGGSDFVLGTLNDLPLSNLLANSRVAEWLFPDTYANRAAAVTYRPDTFIERVDNELETDEVPLFFASHLTLPHWPYQWAADEDAVFARTQQQPYTYLAAVIAVDRQFGQLLDLLERKGVLGNAIVVVFSDHGEGLGLPSDNLLYSREAKAAVGPLLVWMNGHGTSVLSPHQYQIVLGVRGFGENAASSALPAVHREDALGIQDIAPTILDLLGLPATPDEFDGLSFAARLREDGQTAAPVGARRIRFTESAYSTPSLGRGGDRPEDVVAEADLFFQVNSVSGRFEANMDRWDELLDAKERAAIGQGWILAATPGAQTGSDNYIAVPLDGGLPRRLLQPPDSRDEPELDALWRALHEHFPGELGWPAP